MAVIDTILEDQEPQPSAPPPTPEPQESTPKQIRRLEEMGYIYVRSTDWLYADEENWLIYAPGSKKIDYVVRLGYDVSQGMVKIYEAYNKRNDTIKKLKLRDMIMSVWRFKANQDITTLKWINYDCVVEADTAPALDEIYGRIADGSDDDIYILPCKAGREMRKAYCKLMVHSPFAIGAKKMLREYSELRGRSIDGFVVSSTRPGGFHRDMSVYLGGPTHFNIESEDEGTESDQGGDGQRATFNMRGNRSLYVLTQSPSYEWEMEEDLVVVGTYDQHESELVESDNDDWVIVGPDDWAEVDFLDGGTFDI